MNKHILRISVLFLCAIFVVGFVSRPLTASANTAVGYYVITYGAEAASVNPYVLVGILALCALGYVYVSLDEYINEAQSMLSTSEVFAQWTSLLTNITPGMTVTIPLEVQQYLKNKCVQDNKKSPDNLPLMYFPSSFTSLDTISLEDVFPQDTSLDIGNIESSLQENTGILNGIKSVLTSVASSIESGFKKATDKIIEWGSAINYNTGQISIQVKEWVSTVNSNVVTFGKDTVQWLKNVNSNIGYHTDKIFTNFKIWINSSVDIFGGSLDQSQTEEDKLRDDTEEGKIKIPLIIGQAKNQVQRYSSAFFLVSAILTAFIEIAFINDILTFSLALGIFALIVNLAQTLSKKDDSAKKKGGKSSTAKKGG